MKKLLVNIFLFLLIVPVISQNVSDTLKTTLSPNIEIIIITKQLGDNVRELKYLLNKVEKKDTFELMTCLRKDFPNPNIFLDLNNKYLIYEKSDYGNNSHIIIMNIETKEIEFSTEGFIPIPQKYSANFFDKNNNILFYYNVIQTNNSNQTFLMKLDINNMKTEKITTLRSNFEFEYPIIKINTKERKLCIKYSDKLTNNEPIKYEDEYYY